VLGEVGDKQITEDDPSNPVSPYGFHKKAAEELCLSYNKNFDLKISIIRFFSIYGVGLQKQLLWDACMKIKNATYEVSFFGTGEETRDWIYVSDAASLILSVVSQKNNKLIDVINGGTGIKTTVRSTIELLVNLYGKKININFNQIIKPGDPRFYHADTSKAMQLNWSPSINLTEGMEGYISYFKNLLND
jgi:UDP-glucose 4-epimerase